MFRCLEEKEVSFSIEIMEYLGIVLKRSSGTFLFFELGLVMSITIKIMM
jgi:hypothetical protein